MKARSRSIVTTTGELHAENETRMLSWHVGESRDQTSAVMAGLADHAAGAVAAPADLAVWHDLQRWIALGPNDVVIPFAQQIATAIEPLHGSLPPRCRLVIHLHQGVSAPSSSPAASGRPGPGGGDSRRLRTGLPDLLQGAWRSRPARASRTTCARL